MRHAQDTRERRSGGFPATPIFDALYAEYQRMFRALPGDRSGEEALRFEGFGTVHGTGSLGPVTPRAPRRHENGSTPALPPGRPRER
ncbi:hypothetical protein [Streptomyces sp. NPDC005438]|uniref:hypothetical protein n=1 Tax=Streptomyces sp. NPDC005438 TaxID=3156880 RepID=UPI0033B54C02